MSSPPGDRPRDLMIAGHINVDRFLTVASFPGPDRTVPVTGARTALGGTAANLARVASGYGVACGLVARLGDGFPEGLDAPLRRAGIDLRGVERVPGISTPTCYIVEDGRHRQRTFIDQGAMADRRPDRGPPPAGLDEYAWLHLTTGPPRNHLRLLEVARRHGLRVAADPAQEIHYRWRPAQLRALLRGSEIFFGNRSEIARALLLLGLDRPEDLTTMVPLVVRTDGADGAVAYGRGSTVRVRAHRATRVRSIVGAGDAFRGGFYAGWFEGAPLGGCLGAGARAAARWIEGRR